eukprot:scpid5410/ scgid4505/ 
MKTSSDTMYQMFADSKRQEYKKSISNFDDVSEDALGILAIGLPTMTRRVERFLDGVSNYCSHDHCTMHHEPTTNGHNQLLNMYYRCIGFSSSPGSRTCPSSKLDRPPHSELCYSLVVVTCDFREYYSEPMLSSSRRGTGEWKNVAFSICQEH